MRKLIDHQFNGLNNAIDVVARDDRKTEGGAPAWYQVMYGEGTTFKYVNLQFQMGDPATAGVNGISNEALLAVVLDRLRCFQAGAYPCRENALAITKIEEAMMWLHSRVRRLERERVAP